MLQVTRMVPPIKRTIMIFIFETKIIIITKGNVMGTVPRDKKEKRKIYRYK